MANKLTTLSKYVFFLGLGIFFIWWSLKGLTLNDKKEISDALHKGNFIWVIPGLIVMTLSHWLRALRWRLMMEPLGYKPSRLNTFFAVMVGYLANQAVPRLGEVLRCSTLTRYEKIPLDKLLGTVILERIIDTLCLIIVFAFALALQPNLYQNILLTFFHKQETGDGDKLFVYVLAGSITIVLIVVILFFVGRKKETGIVAVIKKTVLHVWQGMMAVKSLKKPWLFLLLSIAIWVLYVVSVYIGFLMLMETQQYGIAEALTVLSAGTLAMAATPGGIGAYAFLVQKTMSIYQLNNGIGLALGWILWLMQVGVVLVVGGASVIGLIVYNKKKRN